MEFNELRKLALAAARAEKNAPVAYSFGNETYSAEQVNEALATEFKNLMGYREGFGVNMYEYERNKQTIFELISDTINEVLPPRIEQNYMRFAEVKRIPQGDKAVFRLRVTEASKRRARTFVTRVGLAGRYEVFMLDGASLEVKTGAIGAAARIGFEEFLDGR